MRKITSLSAHAKATEVKGGQQLTLALPSGEENNHSLSDFAEYI